MYELETMIALYAAVFASLISIIVSAFYNRKTLSRMDANIKLTSKTVDEMKKGELISNYPLLSQKIDTESVQSHSDPQNYESHFKLIIKNFGKGPAINQDHIYYKFLKGEKTHKNSITITGAHDIIAPLDGRPLDLTKLNSDDWNFGIQKLYDIIWIRLPHEDIQRNKCCNCTKYIYQPQIKGKYGKDERYWYFSALPEISSDKCKECKWDNP